MSVKGWVGGILGVSFLFAVGKCANQDIENKRDIADISLQDTTQVIGDTFRNFGTVGAWVYSCGTWIYNAAVDEKDNDTKVPDPSDYDIEFN